MSEEIIPPHIHECCVELLIYVLGKNLCKLANTNTSQVESAPTKLIKQNKPRQVKMRCQGAD